MRRRQRVETWLACRPSRPVSLQRHGLWRRACMHVSRCVCGCDLQGCARRRHAAVCVFGGGMRFVWARSARCCGAAQRAAAPSCAPLSCWMCLLCRCMGGKAGDAQGRAHWRAMWVVWRRSPRRSRATRRASGAVSVWFMLQVCWVCSGVVGAAAQCRAVALRAWLEFVPRGGRVGWQPPHAQPSRSGRALHLHLHRAGKLLAGVAGCPHV